MPWQQRAEDAAKIALALGRKGSSLTLLFPGATFAPPAQTGRLQRWGAGWNVLGAVRRTESKPGSVRIAAPRRQLTASAGRSGPRRPVGRHSARERDGAAGTGNRKLAAIPSADVAGYSRLMGEDERATVHRFTAYRAVFADSITQHAGRVADTAGDSALAEFASVVEVIRSSSSGRWPTKTPSSPKPVR